jgi:hypothetical protein
MAQDRLSVLPSHQLLPEHTATALRNADTSKAYRPIKASALSRLCQPRSAAPGAEVTKRRIVGRRWSVLTVGGVRKCRVVCAVALGMGAVCSEIHSCGRNVELLCVKLAVHIVTTWLYTVS